MNELIELDASLWALWRRKWLVLGGALLAALAAAGISLARPQSYETSTLVDVGRVMGEQLEDAYAVAETVNSAGFQAAARARAPFTGRVTAKALTGGEGRAEHPIQVRVTAAGATPEAAVAAGQSAVAELVARHEERFEKAVAGYREYEKVLAAAAEPEARNAQSGVGPLVVQADPAARRDLGELRAKLASPLFTSETRVVDPFPVPTAPVPRDTLMSAGVAFAVTLAILALLVLALAQVRPPGARSEFAAYGADDGARSDRVSGRSDRPAGDGA